MYACLYRPQQSDTYDVNRGGRAGRRTHPDRSAGSELDAIAQAFSPRYERHHDDLVSIDVTGLERLFSRPERGGPRSVWTTIGEALRREAAVRGVRVHVAVAGTCTAARVLALARPGLTVIERGGEAAALAPIPIAIFLRSHVSSLGAASSNSCVETFIRWGVRTAGELAALPPDDLAARLGRPARVWHAIARGEDVRPLVPALEAERFESSLDLDWPIEGLEPLSFVLTRLLEPLSTRLERRDRGAAVLHVLLRLVTRTSTGAGGEEPVESREVWTRRLELPSPMRDVRTLRTLALLDLESHPPSAAIDRVTIVIDPTPGRVLQHTLFTRAHPTPEQLSTLVARLGAVMGQDRVGAAQVVDSYRPGAVATRPFKTEHPPSGAASLRSRPDDGDVWPARGDDVQSLRAGLRRCRQPVPARVVAHDGHPVRVTTDRRGFAGGSVVRCAGPWRTSGEWWSTGWNRDEWDVSLTDGAVYRIFQDHQTEAWFIEAIVD
jgi:protein ImuB